MTVINTIKGEHISFDDVKCVLPKDIMDIAWTLSNICRFGGRVKRFYSVAEHSVICYYWSSRKNRYNALMHDVGEAYIGDLCGPIKHLYGEFPKLMEENALNNWKVTINEEVNEIDKDVLNMELAVIAAGIPCDDNFVEKANLLVPFENGLGLSPLAACYLFLKCYYEIQLQKYTVKMFMEDFNQYGLRKHVKGDLARVVENLLWEIKRND